MKSNGFLLSVQNVAMLLILVVLIGATGGTGYYMYTNSRNENIKVQAHTLDKALVAYARNHKGIDREELKTSIVTNNYGAVYQQRQDFPLKLTSKGAMYNNTSMVDSGEDFGYILRKIEFFDGTEAAFRTKPENHLYQFFYQPLDEYGNVLKNSSRRPAAFYKLMVYIKTFGGGVTLYESPGSYTQLPERITGK